MQNITVNMQSAEALVLDVLKAKLVPFLTSSPGVGKSSLARQIANKHNLELIDIRLSQVDPVDLNGLIMKVGDKVEYAPLNLFPLEGTPLPEGKKGWLCLLDEFSSAPLAVQAASYKLVLDRQIGNHNLHDKVLMMCAGNKSTDKAITNRISTAMQSRLIHFEIEVDVKGWVNWANSNNVDHRVLSFINFKPEALHKFNPNHNESTFACPRTWEFLSRLITNYKAIEISKLPLLAGTVGEGMAREFYAFSQIYKDLPTIEQILNNPDKLLVPDEPSIQHALTGLLAHHLSETNVSKLIKFIKRMNIDFQVICLRSAISKNQKIKATEEIQEWIRYNAAELHG